MHKVIFLIGNNINVMFKLFILTHGLAMLLFNIPWKHRNTFVFLVFSRGSKCKHWSEFGYLFWRYLPVYWKPYLYTFVPMYLIVCFYKILCFCVPFAITFCWIYCEKKVYFFNHVAAQTISENWDSWVIDWSAVNQSDSRNLSLAVSHEIMDESAQFLRTVTDLCRVEIDFKVFDNLCVLPYE